MDEIQKLYDVLVRDGYYTKSIDEFNVQFQDPAYVDKVFEVVTRDGLYTKDRQTFEKQYAVKKKENEQTPETPDTASRLEFGFSELPSGEQDTWIERTVGKNFITDFFGDIYRSGVQGLAQGATVDDALNLFKEGKEINQEELLEYIEAVQNMEGYQPSDEMKDFDTIYRKEGGGIKGFVLGVLNNPTVVPQIFTSSMAAMLNKGSLAAGAAGAAGAGLLSGGTLALPGFVAGLSGALETGVSFTEFLKEELGDKEFTEENIREVLEDPGKLGKIKARAAKRGVSIAAIDAISGGLASKVGTSIGKNLGKLGVSAAGGGIEAIGGGTGEVVARALADQKMDVAEIGFEAVAGTATAPLTVGAALYQMPKYEIGGVKVNRKKFLETIKESTPAEIIEIANSDLGVKITNDNEVSNLFDKAYSQANIKKSTIEVLPNINEEELNEIVELTERQKFLENNESPTARVELKKVNKQITKITDAVQKRSPKKVDAQTQAKVGEEVGEGDSTGDITTEITSEEIKTTEVPKEEATKLTEKQKDDVEIAEETIELTPEQVDEVNDLEYTLNITEETTETSPDDIPTLPQDLTIEEVVDKGREQGFSDASIKAVLLKRKNPKEDRRFSATEVNEAMQLNLEKNEILPAAIQNIEGGVEKGRQLLREVNTQIESFKKDTETKKQPTTGEVREKALEFLRANEIFKNLSENEQLEVTVAFDKTLQTRANPKVQQEITRIKNLVRGFKKGVKDLRAAQIKLKNFVRNNLKQTDNLLPLITGVKSVKDLSAQAEQVIKKAEQQRARQKKSLIKELKTFINKKSKGRKTRSNKSRAGGLDAQGKDFFTELKKIFKYDASQLKEVRKELNDKELEINESVLKEIRGEKLTRDENLLLDKSLAFDLIADIENKSIEEIEVLFEDLKIGAKESLNRLNRNKNQQAQRAQAIKNRAEASIKKLYKWLFGEDGKLLDKNELDDKRGEISQKFSEAGIFEGIKATVKYYGGALLNTPLQAIRNYFAHLGSLTEILDRYEPGFFKKELYDNVNIMEENSLKGKFNQRKVLDNIANSIPGITKGYKEILNKFTKPNIEITIKGKKTYFSDDNLLRIYALSLNEVQKQKLKNKNGITDKVLADIESKLDKDLIEFADKIVEYFSTDYYEGINDVYSSVNNVNLSYVENYFPTKTVSDKVNKNWFEGAAFDKIFDAETSPAFRERTDKTKAVNTQRMYSFTNVMNDHIESMERYKAFAQGVKDINTIMTDPAVETLMTETGNEKVIRRSLNSIFNPNYGMEQSQGIIGTLFNQFTGYALSFKLIQIPKQASSFVNAFEEYQFIKGKNTPGLDHVAFMIESLKTLLSLFTKDSAYKKALDISATFRERVEQGLQGDIYGLETGGRLSLKPVKKYKEFRKKFRQYKGAPTIIGDIGGVLGYMTNYNRNIANGMSEAEALVAFNNYNATQQSRRGADKIELQRSKNALLRTVTMFGSTAFLQMNKAATGMSAILRRISKGEFKKAAVSKEARAVALNLGIANLLFMFAANMAKYGLGDNDDKEEVSARLFDAMVGLNLIYQMPLLGDAMENQVRTYRGEKPRSGGGVNPLSTIFRDAFKDGIPNPKPIGEIILGTKVDPFVGLYNIIEKGKLKEEDVLDLLGFSASYRPSDSPLTKTQLKELMPDLYDELYGPGSAYDDMQKELKKIKKSFKK